MSYYTVRSSSESIPVDHTGTPITPHPSIVQFNTNEYVGWCQRKGLEVNRGATIDILVLGYWYRVDSDDEPAYEHPEMQARQDILAVCA